MGRVWLTHPIGFPGLPQSQRRAVEADVQEQRQREVVPENAPFVYALEFVRSHRR